MRTQRWSSQACDRLNQAYEFWQADSSLPHSEGYNPFTLAKEMTDLGSDPDKEFHDLSLADLRDKFAEIQNIKRRAITVSC
jgi:integrase/recombinase XerD